MAAKPTKTPEDTAETPEDTAGTSANTAGLATGALTLPQAVALFNGLPAEAILAFKDYGAYVVAVTTNGEKLRADKHD